MSHLVLKRCYMQSIKCTRAMLYASLIVVTIPLMNIQAVSVLNPDKTLRQLEISWIPVVISHIWLPCKLTILCTHIQGGNVTTYTVRVVGADGSVGQGCTVCTTSLCLYVHQVTHVALYYNISVTSINPDELWARKIVQYSVSLNNLTTLVQISLHTLYYLFFVHTLRSTISTCSLTSIFIYSCSH